MVLDSAAKDPFFSQAEREYTRERIEPPPSIRAIWIGRYQGLRRLSADIRDLKGAVGIGDAYYAPANGICFTVVTGCFVAQVMAVGIEHSITAYVRLNKEIEERVIPIRFPAPLIQSVYWPPKLSFDDGNTSLEDFAGRFTAG
jgi:hypothetical protein